MSIDTILNEYNEYNTIIKDYKNKQKELIDKNIIYEHPEIEINKSGITNYYAGCGIHIDITFHDKHEIHFYEQIGRGQDLKNIVTSIIKLHDYIKQKSLSVKYINVHCVEYLRNENTKDIFRYTYNFKNIYEDIKYLDNIEFIFGNLISGLSHF
jgi:hypothetical protein